MVQTKDELIKALAVSQEKNLHLKELDENRRKEFAKAFNWNRNEITYGSPKEPRLPSWEEVYVQVGKFINSRDFSSLEERVDIIHREVEVLKQKAH